MVPLPELLSHLSFWQHTAEGGRLSAPLSDIKWAYFEAKVTQYTLLAVGLFLDLAAIVQDDGGELAFPHVCDY